MNTTLRICATRSACTSCSRISPAHRFPTRPMVPATRTQDAIGSVCGCARMCVGVCACVHAGVSPCVHACVFEVWVSLMPSLVQANTEVWASAGAGERSVGPTCRAEGAAHLAADLRRHAQRGPLVAPAAGGGLPAIPVCAACPCHAEHSGAMHTVRTARTTSTHMARTMCLQSAHSAHGGTACKCTGGSAWPCKGCWCSNRRGIRVQCHT